MSYATGDVSGELNYAGRLIGYALSGSVINAVYAAGTVAAPNHGALIARAGGTQIANCYASRDTDSAALIGSTRETGVSTCYGIGTIRRPAHGQSGLIRRTGNGTTVTHFYRDIETTGVSRSSHRGHQGKTTRELQRPTGANGIYAE